MKVIELIEKLQELVPDRDVTINGFSIKGISRATDVETSEHFYVMEE